MVDTSLSRKKNKKKKISSGRKKSQKFIPQCFQVISKVQWKKVLFSEKSRKKFLFTVAFPSWIRSAGRPNRKEFFVLKISVFLLKSWKINKSLEINSKESHETVEEHQSRRNTWIWFWESFVSFTDNDKRWKFSPKKERKEIAILSF